MKKRLNKKFRKGVFAVVYSLNPLRYLLLHRKLHWVGWEFPKGGLLAKEKEINGVKREVYEETGLKPIKIYKLPKKGSFLYDKKTQQERKAQGFKWQLYCVQVDNFSKKDKVKLSQKEHDGFKWVNYKIAIKLLRWKNQIKCLKIANSFITTKFIGPK